MSDVAVTPRPDRAGQPVTIGGTDAGDRDEVRATPSITFPDDESRWFAVIGA